MNELLVPIDLKALVIGANDSDSTWMQLTPDFRAIHRRNRVLGQQLAGPLEFSPTRANPGPGVHLHWALPDGLTRGVAAADGRGVEFAPVPNRWLVVRFLDRGGRGQPPALEARAWVVESDVVTDDPNAAVWPAPANGTLPGPEGAAVHVGRCHELARWPGETGGRSVPFTAVGYGDPAFAACYPACRGMLGFHDRDPGELGNGAILNYLVLGWYADPALDPLRRAIGGVEPERLFEQLGRFLDAVRWTWPGLGEAQQQVAGIRAARAELSEATARLARLLPGGDATAIAEQRRRLEALETEARTFPGVLARLRSEVPDRIICHGVLTGVRIGDTVESAVPRGRPVRVAVGETMVEALAGLFESQCGAAVSRLLALFQYDLLDELGKPDGEAAVEARIHERRFRPLPAGRRWAVVPGTSSPVGPGAAQREPPVPGEVRRLLELVNERQRYLNELARRRDSARSRLYAAWYRSVLGRRAGRALAEVIRREMADCRNALADLDCELAAPENVAAARLRSADWRALWQALRDFLPGWKVRCHEEPSFWRPNDPVVLLAGEPFRRSPRHGEDGRFRTDGRLLCRLAGQTVAGVRARLPFTGDHDVELAAAVTDGWWVAGIPFGDQPIPEPSASLLREAVLLGLDERRARAVVTAVLEEVQPGQSRRRTQDLGSLARQLRDEYLARILDEARSPGAGNPNLRRPAVAGPGDAVWELLGWLPSPVALSRWDGNPWLPLFLQWQVRWVPIGVATERALDGWRHEAADFAWRGGQDPATGPPRIYRGTTLLTAGAAVQFGDRLRQYNLARGDPGLASLQTAIHSMDLLCQSLGGFTDQLLMRKGYPELRPMEPGAEDEGPQFSPIFDAVRDIDWVSPVVEGELLPLRSGGLTLEKLWVIDAFGQFLRLEEEATPGLAPLVPERLRAANGGVRLPPRLAQGARVALNWLPAGEDSADPVCGWIVPNLLDQGLMIHDARGRALGALQANQRKAYREGAGASREPVGSYHWVDLPGSDRSFFGTRPAPADDPPGPGANPHLRAFVGWLRSLTADGGAFDALLRTVGESRAGGADDRANPGRTLLAGRPFALVRAFLRIETDGDLARAQSWGARDTDTGGIERLRVPLRLGRWSRIERSSGRAGSPARWIGEDGLLGFFVGGDYGRFYPAWGLPGSRETGDFAPRVGVTTGAGTGCGIELTLVMDPGQGLSVSSALLPKTVFHLPGRDPAEVLEDQEMVFFSGPVLGTREAPEMRLPQPSDAYGQWSWTHHPEVRVWRESGIADTEKARAVLGEVPEIRDGWLRLVVAPLAIREFGISGATPLPPEPGPRNPGDPPEPARFRVPIGTRVTLNWSVLGAEEIRLSCGDRPLFISRRHPLPARYVLRIEGDQRLTLVAFGRTPRSAAARPEIEHCERTLEITAGPPEPMRAGVPPR